MKTSVLATILVALGLGAFSATAATEQGKMEMSGDHMAKDMAKEPHHALAMAYHQNLATFAKVLHEQSGHAGAVNVEFARAAAAEMRRSFDQMKLHHQAHMRTMSAEKHTAMSGMMQQMETHRAELNSQLTALEKEVQLATPNAKTVSALAASVRAHLDAMSKVHRGGQHTKMKMKM